MTPSRPSDRSTIERPTIKIATLVGVMTLAGIAVGGVGATFTFKTTAENKDREHDEKLVEARVRDEKLDERVRNVERVLAESIAEIRSDVRSIKESIQRKP